MYRGVFYASDKKKTSRRIYLHIPTCMFCRRRVVMLMHVVRGVYNISSRRLLKSELFDGLLCWWGGNKKLSCPPGIYSLRAAISVTTHVQPVIDIMYRLMCLPRKRMLKLSVKFKKKKL